jgi:hypothetical protein
MERLIVFFYLALLTSCSHNGKDKAFSGLFKRGVCRFGTIQIKDTSDFLPALECASSGKTWALHFGPEWKNYFWVAADRSSDTDYWAILDIKGDIKIESLPFLSSKDQAQSWTVVNQLKKPDPEAIVTRFSMNSKGVGSIHWSFDSKKALSMTQDFGQNWKF